LVIYKCTKTILFINQVRFAKRSGTHQAELYSNIVKRR
jgi:hypothetical protein